MNQKFSNKRLEGKYKKFLLLALLSVGFFLFIDSSILFAAKNSGPTSGNYITLSSLMDRDDTTFQDTYIYEPISILNNVDVDKDYTYLAKYAYIAEVHHTIVGGLFYKYAHARESRVRFKIYSNVGLPVPVVIHETYAYPKIELIKMENKTNQDGEIYRLYICKYVTGN